LAVDSLTIHRGAASRNRPRLLVVDDDPIMTKSLARVLERDGYSVGAAGAAVSALDLLAHDDFDVLLTDAVMAEMTGLELCVRALEARPEIAVIVMTGHATLDLAVEAMRAGASDFITKPMETDLLRAAIARAVERRRLRADIRLERALESGVLDPGPLLGSSTAMKRVRELVGLVATTEASVLIEGETGTGKEVVARALHEASGAPGPFIAVNCAAIPANLIESELFGHVRGAFTDARSTRTGLFLEANHGTIFLDEIGELPLTTQPKLLRLLQERSVRPVGAAAEIPFDARVIAATNRDLEEEVSEKRFREDLYYRINVLRIDVPPLRDRGGDVIELATEFLERLGQRRGTPPLTLSRAAADRLLAHSWPGNVRELQNCIERAAVLARHGEITVADLPEKVRDDRNRDIIAAPCNATEIVPMAELERRYIQHVLTLVGGNKARASHILGISRKTLYRRLGSFGQAVSN
jgi:DNA-binding NtrC family response regulator